MSFLDKLERRFGRYAIPHLGRCVAALNALVFFLDQVVPGFRYVLDLDPAAIREGQVWRLVTYLFIPNSTNVLWVVFLLMFFVMVVDGLEHAWGSFRFNVYYLTGAIGVTIASVFFGAGFANSTLNLSLLFAFAWFYPDTLIYVMFVLPVRIKWLAGFSGAGLVFEFVVGGMQERMAIVAAFANYLLYFMPGIIAEIRQRRKVEGRRRRYAESSVSKDEPLHQCALCGRSDQSDPDLEFRVARDGNDYCLEHLPKAAQG